MSHDLSPDERTEMRQVLFHGADRVRGNGVRVARIVATSGVAVIVAGVVLVAGLNLGRGTSSPAASPSNTATSSLPAACSLYADGQSQLPVAPGGEGIVQAIDRAVLPDGIIMSPGATVTTAVGNASGKFDVVVRVCSAPLTRAELVAVGGAIAAAVSGDAAKASLEALTIQSWVPIGADAIGEDVNRPEITTQFQEHTWSTASPSPPEAWR